MEEEFRRSSRRGFLGAVTALTAASYNRVLGARPAHHHGLRRRQGRLRREAPHRLHRRRQVDAPGMNKYERVANKRDWIDCIKSRKTPFCNLEMGHRTAIICNLGNLSLRLGGRAIQWDPEKEVVVGDKEAAALCTKQYRASWDGVLKSILKA